MDKYAFVKYSAERYGIDESVAETMVDMFADCLQELLLAGQSVEIDGVGKFQTLPLFPDGFNHRNNVGLVKASKRNIVSFMASDQLTRSVV